MNGEVGRIMKTKNVPLCMERFTGEKDEEIY